MNFSVTSLIRSTLALTLSASFAITLSGCATMMGTKESLGPGLSAKQKAAVCALWTGVEWEDADSDDTIVGVKVNNAKRDGFCNGT